MENLTPQASHSINRRSWLKKFGLGALLGTAGMLTAESAQAQTQQNSYSFWTHGNAAVAQFSDRLSSVEHRPTSAVFTGQPGTENWFHIPLTLPVIIRLDRPNLIDAITILKTSEQVFLREAKVFDGDREIGASFDLSETGDIVQRIEILEPVFFIGLGISAKFEFSAQADSPQIEIVSAGVDLLVRE